MFLKCHSKRPKQNFSNHLIVFGLLGINLQTSRNFQRSSIAQNTINKIQSLEYLKIRVALSKVERKVNKSGQCSIDGPSKTGGKLSERGKYFYLIKGEYINQNQSETYSDNVDEKYENGQNGPLKNRKIVGNPLKSKMTHPKKSRSTINSTPIKSCKHFICKIERKIYNSIKFKCNPS